MPAHTPAGYSGPREMGALLCSSGVTAVHYQVTNFTNLMLDTILYIW